MKVKVKNELILLNLLSVVLILVVILFPSNIVRTILGVPFVLFLPGYVLLLALFPGKTGIIGTQRLVLSFAMSLAIVPLVVFIFHFTEWGIRLDTILYSIATFIIVLSVIAWWRRRRLPEAERFIIEFQVRAPSRGGLRKGTTGSRALAAVLLLSILGTTGLLGYVITMPKMGERFTEFYILGPNGKAESYPTTLKLGAAGEVIVGIANNEGKIVTYQVQVTIAGAKNNEVGPVTLKPGEKWEESVSFVPKAVGQQQEVGFLLYKDGELDPNLKPLRLWIDVTE